MTRQDKKAKLRADLQRKIGYHFKDVLLLEMALTHTSAAAEKPMPHNERLEFLGDRVLGMIIADFLYNVYDQASEGELSRRLNTLVRRETCARVAHDLDLMSLTQAGRSLSSRSIAKSINVLGNVCEALIGALYLDGGLEASRRFVLHFWNPQTQDNAEKDSKTFLQEWAVAHNLPAPVYREMAREGPEHLPIFKMGVTLLGYDEIPGEGPSKRRAEQNAAQAFLRSFVFPSV